MHGLPGSCCVWQELEERESLGFWGFGGRALTSSLLYLNWLVLEWHCFSFSPSRVHVRSWRHKPPSDIAQVLYTFHHFSAIWIIPCVVCEEDWLRAASRGCSWVPSGPAVSGGLGQCRPRGEELFSGKVQHRPEMAGEQLAWPWCCMCVHEMCQPSWTAGWDPCPLAGAAEQSPPV